MGNDKKSIDDLISDDSEMKNSFLVEAREHLDAIEHDFVKLEKQKDNPDRELLNKVFRAVHSVKGAAGFLRLGNMTNLAHVMETLLSNMRDGKIRPESEYIDALLVGVDLLSAMLDDIQHSNEVDITGVYERLSSTLLDLDPSLKVPEGDLAIQEQALESTTDHVVEASDLDGFGVDFSKTIRIDVDILDKLMVQAGELVQVRNQYALSVDESDPVSRAISQRLNIITLEMQETILRTRMQPVGKIFGKLPRIVRELEKKFDKQIQIAISGGETELDKTIVESLVDPMTHIIRNCASHGIETPEERVKAGKPESGHITIAAYHEAGRVNIEIKDDGRGIDPALIREKAMAKGLRTEAELDLLSDKEILNLILLPGFTTVDKVSDVFGRGVGMDVVKEGIEKVGGSLDVESTVGEGTTIHLRLPLTLAIIPCLIVTVGENRYAIPQGSLEELVCLYDEDVKTKIECADDQEIYRLRDRLLPMVRLSDVLARPMRFTREVRAEITEKYHKRQEKAWLDYINARAQENGAKFTQSLNFAVLNVGTARFGLIIDQILGTEEIVVKPMHWAMKSLGIYSGVTIMGDGKVALIMDIEGIARHAGVMLEGRVEKAELKGKRVAEDEDLQTVLLFRSGENEQFAIALPLIRRIEPISMSNIEVIGEREYITVGRTSTRVLRLDHALSVSPVVEREEMFLILPRHIKRPVGILVSGLIDTEETPAKVDVDSYMEDGLLGTDIIRGTMTLFLDVYRLVEIIEPEWFAGQNVSEPGMALLQQDGAKEVLVLEDDPFFRHLVKGYLEEDGYHVITAENGQVGLDRMKEAEFDLIVADLDMPVMDGWEFLARVRQGTHQQDIPAMALTALNSDTDRKKAVACGFDRYEVKLDRGRFLTLVAELLGVKRGKSIS